MFTVDQLNHLENLDKAGNNVASAALSLLRHPYASDENGFKQAIEDGFNKLSEIYSGLDYGRPTGFNLPPAPRWRPRNALLGRLGAVGQFWDGSTYGIPTAPGPLASMLVLGTLGAGLGRGVGHVANYLGGGNNPALKQRFTMLGAGLGVLPGAGYAALNLASGKPLLSGDTFNFYSLPAKPDNQKLSYYRSSGVIPVDRFQEMVWEDPFVANSLPLHLRGAASGLIEGANRFSRSRELPFVTPSDVGRMAVGLGSGYASGLIAGKALGALFGVSDESQNVLRQSGAAAGLIRAVVPSVYGA